MKGASVALPCVRARLVYIILILILIASTSLFSELRSLIRESTIYIILLDCTSFIVKLELAPSLTITTITIRSQTRRMPAIAAIGVSAAKVAGHGYLKASYSTVIII